MSLADKIMKLRRAAGLSQEELADRLGVSRQAVSKWESAQSMPDIDKIILLSNFFGVTTDYLLKNSDNSETENITRDTSSGNENDSIKKFGIHEIAGYLSAKFREAKIIAFAVALFILSPMTLISLLLLSEEGAISSVLALTLGLITLFSLVFFGVALCIYSNFLTAPHKLRDTNYTLGEREKEYLQQAKQRTAKRHLLFYICGIAFTIISPLPLIIYSILISMPASEKNINYNLYPLVMLILFALASIGIALLTNAEMRDEAFKSLDFEDLRKRKSAAKAIIDMYWSALPFIYLLISFVTDRWDITWIIWPLSPIIPNIIAFFARRSRL